MSINKLSHLKDWEKIYLEVEKVTTQYDDEKSMCFESNCANSIWVNDDDIFYFPDDLKKLANDGMPKQGEKILVSEFIDRDFKEFTFIWFSYWRAVTEYYHPYDVKKWEYFKLKPQKTELTLAEVESKLGLEKGSLIIK